ncbi:hypothetical protein GGR09_001767, partial [Bartonella heixiaziensis]
MVKVFKNHLSLCAVTTAVLFFVHNAGAKVENDNGTNHTVQANDVGGGKAKNGKNNFSCDVNASSYRCKDGATHFISKKTYQITGENEVAIEAFGEGVFGDKTMIIGEDITIKEASSSDSLDKSSWKYGVVADTWGNVKIEKGAIDFTNGVAVQTGEGGKVFLKDVSIIQKSSQAPNVNNNSMNSAFQMFEVFGHIDFNKCTVKVSNAHGVSFLGIAGHINFFHSTVVVEGNTSYGVLFDKRKYQYNQFNDLEKKNKEEKFNDLWESRSPESLWKGGALLRGDVYLQDTKFMVPNSAAIYSRKSAGSILLQNSTLSGDLLLKLEDGSFVYVVSTENSTLLGGARIDENSHAEFRLRGGSKWTLKRPQAKNVRASSSIGDSSISLIHLIDGSSIVFEKSESDTINDYQTLRIGKGTGEVYKAQGGAHIYLNTYLNSGGSKENQKTDRVLINGDVSGITTVHVQAVSGSPKESTGRGGNNESLSIIQVSGKAEEGSFRLEGDYVTLKNSPYKYRLRAYGPSSDLGKADPSQRLVAGEGDDFWDFRLENEYVVSPVSTSFNGAAAAVPPRGDSFPSGSVPSIVSRGSLSAGLGRSDTSEDEVSTALVPSPSPLMVLELDEDAEIDEDGHIYLYPSNYGEEPFETPELGKADLANMGEYVASADSLTSLPTENPSSAVTSPSSGVAVSRGSLSAGLGRSDTSEDEVSTALVQASLPMISSELDANEDIGADDYESGYVPSYPSFDYSSDYEEEPFETFELGRAESSGSSVVNIPSISSSSRSSASVTPSTSAVSGDGKHTPTALKRTPPADIPVTDIVSVSSEGV